MISPNFFTQKVEEKSDYGKFILEPLAPSFGQSLGVGLRRTLLSSLKGVAITSVKIDEASHLFSTIKGVKESVLDIVLNLKRLKFEIGGEGPFKINLSVKGLKKVYGKDIEGEASVINKDQYIAEVTTAKGKLEIEAVVERGIGYFPAEEREKSETGFIAVDAFFSPVTKVNFKVEEARVGRKSNLDRLILEIWTDKTIKPSDALRQATQLLSEYFSYILSGRDAPKPKLEGSEEIAKKELIDQKLFEVIIDELNLPSRVINALLRENIETVADLVKAGKDSLTDMKGVGKKSIELIEEELKKMGIELK
ncbi:DNA-directed RNA polymerase subunit alpha [Candidatus Roizmanbacteria bacterium RIFCSPLOWO2_01_FULL_37_12]|uniref:DNA-directed RNA polymerase subunit alpha n=1 Tax=Candidatus Roizmanbacteria bacterium RIFCSPLOWO2_01_FULL_37_12 TaxID=1802056 RepID=A0A1F7IBT7_9BACT|nr:MAG: DNA-directed RNA polymerase subunit alpha [Candidatus Roizmanbacteria bacterium RIFCSPHIGHO2_01_FULL_37_16]OGK25989.1 MAG: DNA-directed RNA polymerase subunit alpha [Candidatus Roizmanbacteria bacterium RIFCSPHIGHO2_02_FULL_37_9b]OGK40825.1 MAG: DNA-directed RNA polymerase subunit alpha [Candidatus Roizmanbacteria bacterium RIFCSPLOWO2_01_FULL_37_12]